LLFSAPSLIYILPVGFGLESSNHSPAIVAAIAAFFRQNTPGGAYLIAGTPAHWRTSSRDADRNPAFLDVWLNEFDAISPQSVGHFSDEREADAFAEDVLKPDVDFLKQRAEQGVGKRIDYLPVVFPGTSVSVESLQPVSLLTSASVRMSPRANGRAMTSRGWADDSFGGRSQTLVVRA
jgi:hypothetical protein